MTGLIRQVAIPVLSCLVAATGPREPLLAQDYLLRMTPRVSDEVLYEIARNAEPTAIGLLAGDDIRAAVTEKYGDAATRMWPILLDANKDVNDELVLPRQLPDAALRAERSVPYFVLPAGPFWQESPAPIRLAQGDAVETIVASQVGALVAHRVASEIVAGFNVPADTLPVGTLVPLPYSTRPFFVRSVETNDTVENIVAAAFSEGSLGDRQELPPYIATITQNIEAAAAQACGPQAPPLLDWGTLDQVIRENVALLFPADAPEELDRSTVLVADTGMAIAENRLRLWRGRPAPWGDVVSGFDLTRGDDAAPPLIDLHAEQRIQEHGTHVAGIVDGLQRAGMLNERELHVGLSDVMDRISNIMMLKITNSSGQVDTLALRGLSRFARRYDRARIVNLSIDGVRGNNDVWRDALGLEQYRGLEGEPLYIIAAGNGRYDSDTRTWAGADVGRRNVNLYPATLGGRGSANVISVAALDFNGNLAKFSNYSSDFVDLAAPGCGIESLKIRNGTVKYSGTSQAAPFVSLAASVLYAFGLRRPRDIKDRILSTVDYDPVRFGNLYGKGRLNLTRAVDYHSDVIEYANGRRVRGRVFGDAPIETSSGKYCRDDIERIHLLAVSGNVAEGVLWLRDPNELPAYQMDIDESVRINLGTIMALPAPADWSEVTDIVFSPRLDTGECRV